MSTYTLGAYSHSYPLITNRIRAAVYLQSDPQAFVAEQIDSTPGHPEKTWMFPGLPYGNYGFTLDIIDIDGIPSGNLAKFDVVPGDIDGTLNRADEQITVGSTPNFNPGANDATFDGTNGSPDYRGWSIVPSELTGRGILSKRVDYSWNETTGNLVLLQAGDVFSLNTDWNIHFNPRVDPSANSAPSVFDFDIEYKTAEGNILSSSFGKHIVINLVGTYGEFTLPDIASVPKGRKITIEVDGSGYAVKIKPFGSNVINFLRGNVYILPNEKVSIYKTVKPDSTMEWRVCDEIGNFKLCGVTVYNDLIQSSVFNMKLTDGASVLVNSQYARLYNEFVLNLPATQRCNFDDWSTGDNKYLFSLANSANPINAGKFHFPDRRGLYLRANNTGKAGDYLKNQNLKHNHGISTTNSGPSSAPNSDPIRGSLIGSINSNGQEVLTVGGTDANSTIKFSGGSEARPETVLNNQYILL